LSEDGHDDDERATAGVTTGRTVRGRARSDLAAASEPEGGEDRVRLQLETVIEVTRIHG
jgi:hypothetical protein